jgi:energy-coupling factor transport system substrate-specific component
MRRHLGQLHGPGDVERTILALSAARAPLGDLVSRLRASIRRDGSVAEQANLTAFEILALGAAGQRSAIAKAAGWLERNQNADGGFSFGTRGDPSDVDDTAAAIEALVVAVAPRAAEVHAERFLAANENPDGGYPLEPGGASDSQSTAWVVQALDAIHVVPAASLRYLRARTTASGAVDYTAGNGQTAVWVTGEALAALAAKPLN